MKSKDLDKEKISKQEEKEDKAINAMLPITVMIGTVVGVILSFIFNNFLCLLGGLSIGLLGGILLGSIKAEGGIEFKEFSKKRKK